VAAPPTGRRRAKSSSLDGRHARIQPVSGAACLPDSAANCRPYRANQRVRQEAWAGLSIFGPYQRPTTTGWLLSLLDAGAALYGAGM